ncbi:MAG: hypothetical protein ACI4CC_04215 [Lachnospiraceae bacterium]
MSKMIPIKVEYDFTMKNHRLKAVAEHLESERKFTFYFDEKVVSEKMFSSGDFLTDDDCIRDLVENYCEDHIGAYADLFKRHSDMVHLVSKTIDFVIENFGINIQAHIIVEKGKYFFEVNENNGDDVFSGSFRAENFSEVFEKVRIYTSILGEISKKFSENINELSNDKVEECIKWD